MLRALDDLVRSGKVRYVGCSNYAGVAADEGARISERQGLERFVSQQIHYTLEAREAEYELMPSNAVEPRRGVGILVWSPFGRWAAHRQVPPQSAAAPAGFAPPHRSGRAAGARRRAALTTSSKSWSPLLASAKFRGCPSGAGRGCLRGPASARSWWARAPEQQVGSRI